MSALLEDTREDHAVVERARPAGPAPRRASAVTAALASALAGAVHLGVAPAHWDEWRLEAVAFVVVGLLQVVGGLSLLVRRTPRAARALLASVHGAAVLAWATTRVVGWPVGPFAGEVEPLAAADVVAAVAALVAIVALRGARGALLPRGRRATAVVAGVGVVALAAPAVALVPGLSHDPADHSHSTELEADSFPDGLDLRRRPGDPTAGTAVPVGDAPVDVAVGHGLLWVVNGRDGTLSRVTPGGEVLGSTPVGQGATTVVTGPEAMWVAASVDGTVTRVDPATGEATGVVEVGGLAKGLAVGPDGDVYATSATDSTISRIDPTTLEVLASAPTQPGVLAAFNGPGPGAVAVDGDVVWVVHTLKRELVRFDAATLAPIDDPIDTGGGATDLLVDGDVVWVAATTGGEVWRYDRATGEPLGEPLLVDTRPQYGGGPAALTAAFGDVWVLNNDERTVTRLDGRDGTVLGEPLFLSNYHAEVPRAAGIVGTGDAVWATDYDGDRVVRLAP